MTGYRKTNHKNPTAGKIYDSTQPVENNPFEHNEFSIGVFTYGKPFVSAISGKLVTEVQSDTVSLWSNSYGSCPDIDELPEVVINSTESIIKDLDSLIDELSRHRSRLQQEVDRIKREGIDISDGLEALNRIIANRNNGDRPG